MNAALKHRAADDPGAYWFSRRADQHRRPLQTPGRRTVIRETVTRLHAASVRLRRLRASLRWRHRQRQLNEHDIFARRFTDRCRNCRRLFGRRHTHGREHVLIRKMRQNPDVSYGSELGTSLTDRRLDILRFHELQPVWWLQWTPNCVTRQWPFMSAGIGLMCGSIACRRTSAKRPSADTNIRRACLTISPHAP